MARFPEETATAYFVDKFLRNALPGAGVFGPKELRALGSKNLHALKDYILDADSSINTMRSKLPSINTMRSKFADYLIDLAHESPEKPLLPGLRHADHFPVNADVHAYWNPELHEIIDVPQGVYAPGHVMSQQGDIVIFLQNGKGYWKYRNSAELVTTAELHELQNDPIYAEAWARMGKNPSVLPALLKQAA